jgi:dUTP pyrophosphatase
MNDDEAFMLYVRSSMGFKYNVRMTNQVGVIDADYYNNSDNEGHMWFSLQNHGDKDFVVKKGQAFGQGVFSKFLITDDDIVTDVRNSGIGSTTKEG